MRKIASLIHLQTFQSIPVLNVASKRPSSNFNLPSSEVDRSRLTVLPEESASNRPSSNFILSSSGYDRSRLTVLPDESASNRPSNNFILPSVGYDRSRLTVLPDGSASNRPSSNFILPSLGFNADEKRQWITPSPSKHTSKPLTKGRRNKGSSSMNFHADLA